MTELPPPKEPDRKIRRVFSAGNIGLGNKRVGPLLIIGVGALFVSVIGTSLVSCVWYGLFDFFGISTSYSGGSYGQTMWEKRRMVVLLVAYLALGLTIAFVYGMVTFASYIFFNKCLWTLRSGAA